MSTLPGATHSRAAILCFGGWGLQTMLHLAPRLRAAQERRAACGVEGPDLTRITRFATLLVHPPGEAGETVPLDLHLLRPEAELPPFYLEKVLARLEKSVWSSSWRDFYPGKPNGSAGPVPGVVMGAVHDEIDLAATAGEVRARRLLEMVEDVLFPLTRSRAGEPYRSRNRDALGSGSISRREIFRSALVQGDEIAHLLAANVIDPIRADSLVPGDPFVQTTLYVVAPLYEPLSSALIWPTVAHLMRYLGPRHISQVVGIFATGSYATDSSRVVEDAAAYAALIELEALTGLRRDGAHTLASLVREEGRLGALDEWVGRPLFERIYLVDREKSNQGLVRNSYELAVLVSNALESMISADGSAHIEEQLGIDLRNAQERPYSLLGAASDYAPLGYVFQAVQEQEERRLARESILGEGDAAGEEVASLYDLGATPGQVLAQLIPQFPELFQDVAPAAVQDLAVHTEFVFPAVVAGELRDLNPAPWQRAFDEHFRSIVARFEEAVGVAALDEAWGLTGLRADGLPDDPHDSRFLPATSRQMRAYLTALMGEKPGGLYQVRRQLRHWLAEIEGERRALRAEFLPGERRLTHAERQLALRNWRARYRRALADNPTFSGALLRSALLIGAVVLVALLHRLAFGRPFDPDMDGGVLLGLAVGAVLGSLVSYRGRRRRLQRRRRERIELARQELTALLQERVRQGLARAYEHLDQMLRQMVHALDETVEGLRRWSVAEGLPPLPPGNALTTHLYRPHLNRTLWERCRTFLRTRQDQAGRGSEERLREIWGSLPWRRRLEAILLGHSPEERSLAEGLYGLIREGMHRAVTGLSRAGRDPARAELIRNLAVEYNLEHLLWRDVAGSGPRQAAVRSNGQPTSANSNVVQRYLETLWSNAKPAANYDVSDRLATHGIAVDFAAVSGDAESDLTQAVLQDFRVARLLTGDPFQITFVRTVHGIELYDLGAVMRYRGELARLGVNVRARLLLAEPAAAELYDITGAVEESREIWV